MVITMSSTATKEDINQVRAKIKELGYDTKVFKGVKKTVIHVIGATDRERIILAIEPLPGVEKITPILSPFKLGSREFHPEDTIVKIDGVSIGGKEIVVMAGPCAVESEEIVLKVAQEVKKAGGKILRGGAFKPRTSPYSFQGLGEKGLKILGKAREKTGLLIITEVLSEVDVPLVAKYADILQIGARNMQNFQLLKTVGRFNKPVLLKRGISATIEEWLMSAEYIQAEGNPNVILCERGIRTFETYTRYTLDISTIPVIKNLSHLPIVVDPSHPAGDSRYVPSLARAAIAAGADGLIIEVHPDPSHALSDGKQSITPLTFQELMEDLRKIAKVVGREL
ncbi:MAG: 3-deoxy-7-phosphoheptulonate synthase [candidate division WOR-3 bacterium]